MLKFEVRFWVSAAMIRMLFSAASPRLRLGTFKMRANASSSAGFDSRAQVGDGVFDLGALVEPQRARHLVGESFGGERFLAGLGLVVGPVEDGNVGECAAGAAVLACDADGEGGLVV